jgi:hypothetical protein
LIGRANVKPGAKGVKGEGGRDEEEDEVGADEAAVEAKEFAEAVRAWALSVAEEDRREDMVTFEMDESGGGSLNEEEESRRRIGSSRSQIDRRWGRIVAEALIVRCPCSSSPCSLVSPPSEEALEDATSSMTISSSTTGTGFLFSFFSACSVVAFLAGILLASLSNTAAAPFRSLSSFRPKLGVC